MSDTNARFYHPSTLEVMTEVLRAKPKKMPDGSVSTMRKATIADAKKNGWLESVTTIIKDTFATSPQLIDWITEQVLDACIHFPLTNMELSKDMESEAVKTYKAMIYAKANEYRDFTADRGKFIHACINRWIALGTKPDDPACIVAIEHLQRFMKDNKVTKATSEYALGSKEAGFAGTPDIYCETEGGVSIIIDTKTTCVKSFTKPYDSWKIQLGAYRILTKMSKGTRLVQMVTDRDNGSTLFLDHEDPDKYADAFSHLMETHCIVTGHDPRKFV